MHPALYLGAGAGALGGMGLALGRAAPYMLPPEPLGAPPPPPQVPAPAPPVQTPMHAPQMPTQGGAAPLGLAMGMPLAAPQGAYLGLPPMAPDALLGARAGAYALPPVMPGSFVAGAGGVLAPQLGAFAPRAPSLSDVAEAAMAEEPDPMLPRAL